MDKLHKPTEQYLFSTTTADVVYPDDFVVEFHTQPENPSICEPSIVKIKNLDELIDFLDKMKD